MKPWRCIRVRDAVTRDSCAIASFRSLSTTSGLNISKEYDPYLRPNHGAVADICNVSLKIMSIMDINNQNNMEFSMDFVLTKAWTDPRLHHLVEKETVFMNEFPHKIWSPDVYIVNAGAYRPQESSRRTFRLKPEGELTFNQRYARSTTDVRFIIARNETRQIAN